MTLSDLSLSDLMALQKKYRDKYIYWRALTPAITSESPLGQELEEASRREKLITAEITRREDLLFFKS